MTAAPPAVEGGFQVRLDVFSGPFDLLLRLIVKHELDVTEVALAKVTDDFLAHLRELGDGFDLGAVTEFLVVAATLLDLKTARLLPTAEVEDEEDIALLEERDLLFARLLQYRAYQQAAGLLAVLLDREAVRHPRAVALEARFAGLLPEVDLGVDPARFAAVAARALTPRPVPVVSIAHVHAPAVSVEEQTRIVEGRLRRSGSATFRALTADCSSRLEVVARFLGLLLLFRDGRLAFDQAAPLADLLVRWVGEPG